MPNLSLRPNVPFDLAPLSRLLADEEELALVNPSAKAPFDPLEWQEKWLNEPDDASYYLVDEAGREVGFFALRIGVGPEVRHLVYVFVEKDARGGAGGSSPPSPKRPRETSARSRSRSRPRPTTRPPCGSTRARATRNSAAATAWRRCARISPERSVPADRLQGRRARQAATWLT
ncbi:GNAT family N-acetyltransferase [Lutibaculum baratangense]|uniref:GNAT family N-acetyltransferase n=1 Tax=Lutibaculum baratangense TaxID=1358440 RepID=UPI001FCCACA2|nr:GNAT family N-acetyltransferase [Lutibaculum baratangense]